MHFVYSTLYMWIVQRAFFGSSYMERLGVVELENVFVGKDRSVFGVKLLMEI